MFFLAKLDKNCREKLYKKKRRQYVHVPETPEEKLKNQGKPNEDRKADEVWEDERKFNVIPQTPIGKIRKGNF